MATTTNAEELESNSKDKEKLQRVKCLVEKFTSLTNDEVSVINAILSISRSLG